MSGTLHSASNDAATYTYAYDALNRVTDTTSTISGLQSTVNLHEGYNRWGVRTSLKATIGTTSDFENVYTYHHALGYLETVEQKAQTGGSAVIDKIVIFHNDILGRWDTIDCKVKDPDSPYSVEEWVQVASTERDFDHAGRVSEIRQYRSIVNEEEELERWPSATLTYSYDQANRLTHSTASGGVTYAYDDASQLTGVDYAAMGLAYADAAITYDHAGNRDNLVSTTYSGAPPEPKPNTYDYQAAADNCLSTDGTYSYQYDAEGNRTVRTNIATGVTTRYTWDHRNRLTKVSEHPNADPQSTPTKVVENFYDAFDRRVGKKVTQSGQSDRYERYVYDGSDMVLAFEGTTSTLTGTDLKHRYLWGEAVDQLLADENLDLGMCYFPQADQEGSIVNAGGYSPTYNQFGGYNADYDAFGNAVAQVSSDIRFRYTSQEWDADAGLYYYNARWYDPHTSQFLSQDPLGFAAGDANLYRYVGNNVTNVTDPSGLVSYHFGEAWVMPWEENAGFFASLNAWGRASVRGSSVILHGAAGGAATGMATGLVVGAVGGTVTAGPAGTLVGAGGGAASGLIGGTVVGANSGFWAAWNMRPEDSLLETQGNAAIEGLHGGVLAGFFGGLEAVARVARVAGSLRVTDNACGIPTEYRAPAGTQLGSAPGASQGIKTPGKISSNPNNKLVDTGIPRTNGNGWRQRWIRMSDEDEARHWAERAAASDRHYLENPAASQSENFDRMSAWLREWFRGFVDNRPY